MPRCPFSDGTNQVNVTGAVSGTIVVHVGIGVNVAMLEASDLAPAMTEGQRSAETDTVCRVEGLVRGVPT